MKHVKTVCPACKVTLATKVDKCPTCKGWTTLIYK